MASVYTKLKFSDGGGTDRDIEICYSMANMEVLFIGNLSDPEVGVQLCWMGWHAPSESGSEQGSSTPFPGKEQLSDWVISI